MGWTGSFGARDFVTIGLSVAAIIMSVTSWRTAVVSGRHASVSSQMQLFLGEYVAALDAEPLAYAQCGYGRTTARNQQRARIVLGLLVNLVEAMDAAGDRRAAAWRRRLADLPGPLYDPGWDPAIYAGTARMAGEIAALRKGRMGKVDCSTSS